MPVPLLAPPALQVPSHLPWQSIFGAVAVALQAPVQLAVHVPVHSSSTFAVAVQPPLQLTLMVPPVHLGGLAFTSHIALASQEPSQLAVA
jgi:hypothetical protein